MITKANIIIFLIALIGGFIGASYNFWVLIGILEKIKKEKQNLQFEKLAKIFFDFCEKEEKEKTGGK
jgi:hypothetical protein